MFTIFDKEQQQVPIKVWLKKEELENNVLEQARVLTNLPFVYKWISLMPDCHYGYGMPIGGVMASKEAIVPYAVGQDIGCGMCYIQTDISYEELSVITDDNQSFFKLIVNQIMRDVPVGHSLHKTKQESVVIDRVLEEGLYDSTLPEADDILEKAYYQVGTLGGGNHFIEFQQDEQGKIGIMIHSGSRHLGAKICQYFNGLAKELNQKWYSAVPENNPLPFLPVNSTEGQAYIKWMTIALDFAYENRETMLTRSMEVFSKQVNKHLGKEVTYSLKVNCHHNYAALEKHYGEKVWVHRKGATRARDGELGIIPGAMGSYSYIVSGLGNEESFHSSSHGAGRVYSRKRAKEEISVESVILDLRNQEVVLGKQKKNDVAEESRFAYKNIDEVMANQQDLVLPI